MEADYFDCCFDFSSRKRLASWTFDMRVDSIKTWLISFSRLLQLHPRSQLGPSWYQFVFSKGTNYLLLIVKKNKKTKGFFNTNRKVRIVDVLFKRVVNTNSFNWVEWQQRVSQLCCFHAYSSHRRRLWQTSWSWHLVELSSSWLCWWNWPTWRCHTSTLDIQFGWGPSYNHSLHVRPRFSTAGHISCISVHPSIPLTMRLCAWKHIACSAATPWSFCDMQDSHRSWKDKNGHQ